jgi:hypothetical protein
MASIRGLRPIVQSVQKPFSNITIFRYIGYISILDIPERSERYFESLYREGYMYFRTKKSFRLFGRVSDLYVS